MIGLSEGCQKVVRGELWDHFCSMKNFLLDQNDYPEVVKIPKGCHRVVILC